MNYKQYVNEMHTMLKAEENVAEMVETENFWSYDFWRLLPHQWKLRADKVHSFQVENTTY